MTDERMGQIALRYVRYKMGKDGFRVHPSLSREVAAIAKEIHIPYAEAAEFTSLMLRELTGVTISCLLTEPKTSEKKK